MTYQEQLEATLRRLVDAIDRKWSLETEKRRSSAVSPAMDEALIEARKLLGIQEVGDIEQYRARFRNDGYWALRISKAALSTD